MKLNSMPTEKGSSLPKISQPKKYDSPFSIPDDAEIFRMKEKQKERKKQEKTKNQKLKIWEKGVKKQGFTIKELNNLGGTQEEEQNSQAKLSLIEAAKTAIKNRVKINEPMHDFISKKRDTLLFQMLIDHKRQKINEFQELSTLHRKGLERAQNMLQEDMESLNAYLNENKKQARDAIKNAENQTRLKNQKVAYIKQRLEVQADLTGKNMSKRQTLQNLKKYKIFLQSLGSELSQDERKKRQQKFEQDENSQVFGGVLNYNQEISQSSSDQEMQFKQPQQLMDIFHALQQNNLFLISNLKQIQQEIQQLKSSFNHKKEALSGKKNQLISNKGELIKQINQIDQQIEDLKKTTNKDEISDYFLSLQNEIIHMSQQTGLIQVDQKHFQPLDFLKDIEKKIQSQLKYLMQAKQEKPALIHTAERNCINQKREKNKLKNNQEMNQKAIKQKQDSPMREKRKGRPIMARSIVKSEVKKQQVQVVEPIEEIQRRKYLM